MDTPLIDTAILFAESEEAHVCCSCCEGYCAAGITLRQAEKAIQAVKRG